MKDSQAVKQIEGLTLDDEPVILVEFHNNNEIRNAWTEKDKYSFDFSKAQDCYLVYKNEDSICSRYFTNLDNVENYGGEKLEKLPLSFDELQKIFNEASFCESVVDCCVCEDTYEQHQECKHLQWSDIEGMYIGCGSCEISNDDDVYKNGIFKILNTLGRDKTLLIRHYIQNHDYYFHILHSCEFRYVMSNIPELGGYINCTDIECEDDEINAAVLWLKSLEKGVTLDAEKQTIEWIDSWLNA